VKERKSIVTIIASPILVKYFFEIYWFSFKLLSFNGF
jgi:hypothetical protein